MSSSFSLKQIQLAIAISQGYRREKDMKTRTIEFEVTREEIENGFRENMHICPIALAITKAVPEITHISVWGSHASFLIGENEGWHSTISNEMYLFTQEYDEENWVSPQKFRIEFHNYS